MSAVASVVLNRVAHPGWWGRDVHSCCRMPYQFSCWLAGDPNLPKLLAVTVADLEFRVAQAIADLAMAGRLADITGGADSYFAAGSPPPAWSIGKVPTAIIGRHRFYKVGTT